MRSALLALLAAIMFASMADAKVLITIDKSTQQMTVAVDGAPRWTWPVSTGRRGRATPSGNYRAFRMEKDHFSREWDDAPMPHSIFFTKTGHAIHGSYEIKKLGTPASAGCVRLHPDHAARLFALVEQQGVLNTTVIVAGDEAAPTVARGAPRQLTPMDDPVPPGYASPPGYAPPGYASRAYQPSYAPPPIYQRAPPPPYYAPPPRQYEPQPPPRGGYYRWP